MSVTLWLKADDRLRSNQRGSDPWIDQPDRRPDPLRDGFISALLSDGDSRIATDSRTGLNKYLCPPLPAPDLVCASSCTASPMSVQGFERAAEAFSRIAGATSARQRADRQRDLSDQIEARLLRYFAATSLARAWLCPSGTDALLTTTLLLAAERPNEALTVVLPAAAETGTGVPMAAIGRVFDGPDSGTPLAGCVGRTIEVPLRLADGSPCPEDRVNDAFAAAAAKGPDKASDRTTSRVIVYLTHGSKTGLIAPTSPPEGVEVIVDACQGRIEPATVAAYLGRGWPVVVTGSKFFGGPAFSGAVLFPRARRLQTYLPTHPGAHPAAPGAGLGTLLRWTAALAEIDAFEPRAAAAADILADRIAIIRQALADNPALVPVEGLSAPSGRPNGEGWADLPSIFTFGVRDPADRGRLLSATELRPLHERLARGGILLGQPVGLGRFGGLRIAMGARDLLEGPQEPAKPPGIAKPLASPGLAGLFAALEAATRPH